MLGRMLASEVEKNLGQKVNEKNFRLARAGECGSAMAIGTEEIDGREEVNKKGKGGDYAQRL